MNNIHLHIYCSRHKYDSVLNTSSMHLHHTSSARTNHPASTHNNHTHTSRIRYGSTSRTSNGKRLSSMQRRSVFMAAARAFVHVPVAEEVGRRWTAGGMPLHTKRGRCPGRHCAGDGPRPGRCLAAPETGECLDDASPRQRWATTPCMPRFAMLEMTTAWTPPSSAGVRRPLGRRLTLSEMGSLGTAMLCAVA